MNEKKTACNLMRCYEQLFNECITTRFIYLYIPAFDKYTFKIDGSLKV